MKFIDEVTIEVFSGNGGHGMVAFRREKFVNMGGPSGGDGGDGGDVIFEATDDLNTLYEMSFKRTYKAQSGENGKSKNQAGKRGEDLVIKVPVGTLVYDQDTSELLADLTLARQSETILKGGTGGKGNARFASSVHQTPRMAEKGEPGRTLKLRLLLKLIADVGLVGLPNAGKSTFLRLISNARPKVADYPFTTMTPALGIVKHDKQSSFCVADIPGLIEGAHEGAGLGIQFLRHIERTRLLLHLIDMSSIDMEQPLKEYDTICNELQMFSEKLANKPMLIVANKMDLPDSQELFVDFKNALKERGVEVFSISGATGAGVDALLKDVSTRIQNYVEPELDEVIENETLYKYLPPFSIEKLNDDCWQVNGAEIEKLVAMTDFTSFQAIARFLQKLRKMGFIEELAALKLEDDVTIIIGEMEFEYREFFT